MERYSQEHPPKPRLVLRVGVTGHRPNDFPSDGLGRLREQVKRHLLEIRRIVEQIPRDGLYDPAPAELHVVSRLAAGADLIVAEEGNKLKFTLQCPLPFAHDEYAKDIDAGWKDCYGDIRAHAAVFELDGETDETEPPAIPGEDKRPSPRVLSFLDCRRAVVRNCDVLIAIRDPERPSGLWGTKRILKEARRDALLTIVIPPRTPEDATLELGGEDDEPRQLPLDQLEPELRRMLVPPLVASARHGSERKISEGDYFTEKQPHVTLGFPWRMLRNFVSSGLPGWPCCCVKGFEETTAPEWQRGWPTKHPLAERVTQHVDAALRPHYAWADKLATYYADLTRSAVVFNYLAGAVAVGLALLGYAAGWTRPSSPWHRLAPWCIAGELVTIALIIVTTWRGGRSRWHDRWIDYRLLAEHLRVLRVLMPLGRIPPHIRLPAHLSYGDVRNSWVFWLYRAIVREAGMVTARLDETYAEACREMVLWLVDDQATFQKDTAVTLAKVEDRLHWLGTIFFVATGLACFTHVFVHWRWLTWAAAVFPAFGAAFAAIRSHNEIERIARRARSMAQHLATLKKKLGATSAHSRDLGPVAEEVAQCITNEVLDWRTLFEARGPRLPG